MLFPLKKENKSMKTHLEENWEVWEGGDVDEKRKHFFKTKLFKIHWAISRDQKGNAKTFELNY